jgi:recombination protein RecA
MAKKINMSENAFKHLEGFGITTAKFNSPGNIPTGHFNLDFAIHFGTSPDNINLNTLEGYDSSKPLGLPLGKVIEISGEEGSGKSSLAYRVIGAAQKLGYTTAWLDAEHSFSEALASINGCNSSDIIMPDNNISAEEFLDMIEALCRTDKVPMIKNGKKILVDAPKVIVLDSIASLVPKAVGESLSEQQFMGLLPRIMSQNMGKIAGAAEANGVLLIFINQIREQIGVMFGDPEKTPGGRALKHSFSLRLKVTKRKSKEALINRIDEETGEEILIGRNSYVKIEKNRFAKPMLDIMDIPIYYEEYFPAAEEIAFNVGRQMKIVSIRNKIYNWEGNKSDDEGKEAFIKNLKDKGLMAQFISDIKAEAIANSILLPPELSQYKEKDDGKSGNVQRSPKAKNSTSVPKKSKKT